MEVALAPYSFDANSRQASALGCRRDVVRSSRDTIRSVRSKGARWSDLSNSKMTVMLDRSQNETGGRNVGNNILRTAWLQPCMLVVESQLRGPTRMLREFQV